MKVAKAVLSRLGHSDVTGAKDGVDALAKVQADPAGLDAFDIVLMDLHMPITIYSSNNLPQILSRVLKSDFDHSRVSMFRS